MCTPDLVVSMTCLAEAELLSSASRFELAVVLVFISQIAPIFHQVA